MQSKAAKDLRVQAEARRREIQRDCRPHEYEKFPHLVIRCIHCGYEPIREEQVEAQIF